jgi:hypothetical protein
LKLGARIALVVAVIACAWAIFDFSYNAYQTRNCFTSASDDDGLPQPRTAVDSDFCREAIASRDSRQRLDAGVIASGILLLIGAVVLSSDVHRKTKKRFLMVGAAAGVIGVVYAVVLFVASR